jgi:hypothetical protein
MGSACGRMTAVSQSPDPGSHVLLCKRRAVCHLRAAGLASTIELFLLASFPRRPCAPQAVPGGATDSETDNGN